MSMAHLGAGLDVVIMTWNDAATGVWVSERERSKASAKQPSSWRWIVQAAETRWVACCGTGARDVDVAMDWRAVVVRCRMAAAASARPYR
tara:strand:- start:26628 stop:26897 length:270 start_codon:yes stop_codon:yes gene_type:complete